MGLQQKLAELQENLDSGRQATTFKEITNKKNKSNSGTTSKTTHDNNFTNVTLMSTFHKTKLNDETIDCDESNNWETTKQFGSSLLSTTNILPISKVYIIASK